MSLNFFFQHHIHEKIFNTFCINFHPFFIISFNSILTQLLNLIQFKCQSMYLNSIEKELDSNLKNYNSIQGACNVIQYFHSNGI
jgi:hypothetical protein